MLYDRAKIHVAAGAGGGGAVSFRREAHVPKGGPDGGDGGRGADVVLVSDPSLRDLQAFRHKVHWKARGGGHGEGGNRHGQSPTALEVPVPPGTLVEGDDVRADLTEPGARLLVATGGAGGRGNRRFTTSRRQAPRFAERGLPGEERWLELRLKLLADVGLVGLPNAGKSSLLARLTRARPKVADYPFTTLEPVLGTLERGDRQLVLADIPGLIEGASAGAGLGHEFLAHVERTRVLVHVVDVAPADGSDPAEGFATVEQELRLHEPRLAALPRIVALSKADLLPDDRGRRALEEWGARTGGRALAVLLTSAATGAGLDELAGLLMEHVPEGPEGTVEPSPEPAAPAGHRTYRPGAGDSYRVERTQAGVFRVTGGAVERLIARHDLDNEEALRYVEDKLRGMGVIRALEAAGFQPGDDVEMGGIAFEFDPGAPFR